MNEEKPKWGPGFQKIVDELKAEGYDIHDPKYEIEDLREDVEWLTKTNSRMLTLLCDIDEELSRAQADAIETGNMTGSSLPANLIIRLRREINKAKGAQG